MNSRTRIVRFTAHESLEPLMRATFIAATVALCLPVASALGATAVTQAELASVRAGSTVAAGGRDPSISNDGRFVAFQTRTGNVVANDTPTWDEVYLRDRVAGTTERISISYDGGEPNCDARAPSISGDGRFVAFMSCSTNLVVGQPDVWGWHVFVRDRVNKTTEMTVEGLEPSLSYNGRYIAYLNAVDNNDVYVIDRWTRNVELISVDLNGNPARYSYYPSISRDGRFVAFFSANDYLVPGDTNRVPDIFLRDRATGTTERVSVGSNYLEGNNWSDGKASISNDGRYVAFRSIASNFTPGDSLYSDDIFVRDRVAGTTERVSVTWPGGPMNTDRSTFPSISGDGRFVLFEPVNPNAGYRRDVFVRDRLNNVSLRVSPARMNRDSRHAVMSASGRFVAFDTEATNLVLADATTQPDAYLVDRSQPAASVGYTLTPAKLNFGNVAIGTGAGRDVRLENTSGAPLPIVSVTLQGADPSQFRVTHDCGASVAAGGYCTLLVSFVPTSVGVKTTDLKIIVGDYQIRTWPVTGTGVQ